MKGEEEKMREERWKGSEHMKKGETENSGKYHKERS